MEKKIVKVLEGIVITGAAAGGAAVMADADYAYAMELEDTLVPASGEYVLEVKPDEALDQNAEVTTEATTETSTETNEQIDSLNEMIAVAETEQAEASQNIAEEEAIIADAEAEKASIDEQIVEINSEITEDYNQIEQKEEELAEVDSQLGEKQTELSGVNSSIEAVETEISSVTAENTAATNEINTAQSLIDSDNASITEKQQLYDNSGYGRTGLQEQEAVITEMMGQAQAQLANKTVISTSDYVNYLRPLAAEMIKYTLVQSGEVEYGNLGSVSIVYYKNSSGSIVEYYNSHFCVRYVNTNGELREKYYDYVTCNKEDGHSMIKTDPYNDNTPDLVENFGGINIVSKTPTYLDINGNITTDYVYYTDAEYKALPAAEKALYKKSTKINGVTYHYANRAGWYVDPEASPEAIKGGNSYTKNQFTNDVALRNSLPAEIEAIQADITNQTNTINEKQQLINENEAKISKYTNQINDYTATKNEITNAMAGLQEIKQTIVEEIAALKADIQVLEDKIDELLAQKDQLDEVIEQHTEMKAEYQAIYDAKVSEISDLKADVEAAVADLEVQKREIEDVITTAVQDESVIVEQSGDTYNPFALDEAKVPLFLADTNETAQGEVGTGDGAIQISDFQHEQAPALETVSPELAVVDVEIPEADLEPVIIEDEEVAKYAVLHRVNWNGTALPFIGTIAGFIGLTKVKKEEEQ